MMLCNKSINEKELFELSKTGKWLYSRKVDGIRAMLHIQNENIVKSRSGKDITNKFPEFRSLKVQLKRCVLDGEICCIKDGKEDFGTTLSREHTQDRFSSLMKSKKFPAVFFCFDIVVFNNKDVSNLPLFKRIKLLNSFNQFNELETDQLIKLKRSVTD